MVDATARPNQKGFVGRVAGAVTGRVVDVVDPDIVLDHVDVNAVIDKVDLNAQLDKVDVQRLLERVDLDPVLSRVDVQALLERVDLNSLIGRVDLQQLLEGLDLDPVLGKVDLQALLERVDLNVLLSRVDLNVLLAQVDVNQLLDQVDVNRALAEVDIEALVGRSGIPEIVAESTSQLAGSTLDVARRQVAALDFWVNRVVDRLMRRPAGSVPASPPALAEEASEEPEGGRRQVTGHYAGPVGRLLAFAIDAAIVTLVYTGAGATIDWLARIFFDQSLVGQWSPWVSAIVLTTWLFAYFFGSWAVAGHTPGQTLVGLRVVARDGTTLSPLSALERTLTLPLSFLLLGLGFVGIVIGREHRALHDVIARSAVVLDFGDRPAELPGPLSRFLDSHDL
jgi:uncharacterized RDD family membrane protein YckC